MAPGEQGQRAQRCSPWVLAIDTTTNPLVVGWRRVGGGSAAISFQRPIEGDGELANVLAGAYRDAVVRLGTPPVEARLAHSATLATRRRHQLLLAAGDADLPRPTLVPAPVAIAHAIAHDEAGGAPIAEGSYVLVCGLRADSFESCVVQARSGGYEMVGDPVGSTLEGGAANLRDQLQAPLTRVTLMEEADGLANGWISAMLLAACGPGVPLLRQLLIDSHPGVPLLGPTGSETAVASGATHPLAGSGCARTPGAASGPSAEPTWQLDASADDGRRSSGSTADRHVVVGVAATTVLSLAAVGMLPDRSGRTPPDPAPVVQPAPLATVTAAPEGDDRSGALVALDALLTLGDVPPTWDQTFDDQTPDLHQACGGRWHLAELSLNRQFSWRRGATTVTSELKAFESSLTAQASLLEAERNITGCAQTGDIGRVASAVTKRVPLPSNLRPRLGAASFAIATITSDEHPIVTLYGIVRVERYLTAIELSAPAARRADTGQPVVGGGLHRRFWALMLTASRRLERSVGGWDGR